MTAACCPFMECVAHPSRYQDASFFNVWHLELWVSEVSSREKTKARLMETASARTAAYAPNHLAHPSEGWSCSFEWAANQVLRGHLPKLCGARQFRLHGSSSHKLAVTHFQAQAPHQRPAAQRQPQRRPAPLPPYRKQPRLRKTTSKQNRIGPSSGTFDLE